MEIFFHNNYIYLIGKNNFTNLIAKIQKYFI